METTGIYRITPSEITMKQKFGQNMNDNVIAHVIKFLEERNTPFDLVTVAKIKNRRSSEQ